MGKEDPMPKARHPRKNDFRTRAHANPLAARHWQTPRYPGAATWPDTFPGLWSGENIEARSSMPELYSAENAQLDGVDIISESEVAFRRPRVAIVDLGCGFGGLLTRLAPLFPATPMLGLEIRGKVADYVGRRTAWFRECHEKRGEDGAISAHFDANAGAEDADKPLADPDHHYRNSACLHANAMVTTTHFFEKGSLERLFFLYPDPHFKRAKHRLRAVTRGRLAEYAYLLKVGGIVYTVTDVLDLHVWMRDALAAHPLFERVDGGELEDCPVLKAAMNCTEEGMKVARNNGAKHAAVFRRIRGPGD